MRATVLVKKRSSMVWRNHFDELLTLITIIDYAGQTTGVAGEERLYT